jgi:hypothetical protein
MVELVSEHQMVFHFLFGVETLRIKTISSNYWQLQAVRDNTQVFWETLVLTEQRLDIRFNEIYVTPFLSKKGVT